jgi:hypothetical protein
MGKAIREDKSEVEKCAWAIEYYADHGKIFVTVVCTACIYYYLL